MGRHALLESAKTLKLVKGARRRISDGSTKFKLLKNAPADTLRTPPSILQGMSNENIPHLANITVQNTVSNPIHQKKKRATVESSVKSKRMCTKAVSLVNEMKADDFPKIATAVNRLNNLNGDDNLAQMVANMEKRQLNGAKKLPRHMLKPPRNYNREGDVPPQCPTTIQQLSALSGADLNTVMEYYELENQNTDDEKRDLLSSHYGIVLTLVPGLMPACGAN